MKAMDGETLLNISDALSGSGVGVGEGVLVGGGDGVIVGTCAMVDSGVCERSGDDGVQAQRPRTNSGNISHVM